MSISNIRPSDCPAELRVKIEKVMAREKLNWRDAVLFWPVGWFHPANSNMESTPLPQFF